MLRYYTCLRIQHASKECCVHSTTFFQGKTCSKYCCIYPFERNSAIFKRMPHNFMQYVRYSFKRVLHPFKDFLYKTLSKYYYCIYWRILLHRNSTLYYNMPHWPQLFCAMCPVLFESNTASNEGLSLQVRLFQSPESSIKSIKAFCYKAMLHVLKVKKWHSEPCNLSAGC